MKFAQPQNSAFPLSCHAKAPIKRKEATFLVEVEVKTDFRLNGALARGVKKVALK